MPFLFVFMLSLGASSPALAKEIALTFDDAPMESSDFFETHARTEELIRKLKALGVPPVIVFANPCRRKGTDSVIRQLKMYKEAGHLIGNHTCSHPRLDRVGFTRYARDAAKGDRLLGGLLPARKFFRFPFLNEGGDVKLRDRMRRWLASNGYRNGMVSVDTEHYAFSFKLHEARARGKTFDLEKVRKLFVDHVAGAADFYDELAVKALGSPPKHVMLLHEMDATVLFIEPLVLELRKRGWTIIGADRAYRDKLYDSRPKNTWSGNGIIAQMALEATGREAAYRQFDEIKSELDQTLGLAGP